MMKRFKMVEEYSILESLLLPQTPALQLGGYVSSIRKLKETHSKRRPVRAPRIKSTPRAPVVDSKLVSLLKTRNLTSKDIDAWIQINVIEGIHPYEVLSKVDAVLEPMIRSASVPALWAIMQFLAKYWDEGVQGVRPFIRTARHQAEMVLERALEVSHPTEYSLGNDGTAVELVGIPDFGRFDRFVASLYEYMEITPSTTTLDPTDDLLFRLHARCGSIANAQDRAKKIVDAGMVLSGASSEELLSTLSRQFAAEQDSSNSVADFRDRIKGDLGIVQDLLSSDITPGSMRFLLVWLTSIDELWALLATVEEASNLKEIYTECQLDLIKTIEKFGLVNPRVMAQATGLLARIKDHAALTSESMDYFLLACAKVGNAAGLSSALELRRELGPLSEKSVRAILDSFPLTNFGSTLGDSRKIIHDIRRDVLPSSMPKWIYALSRAGGDIVAEWEKVDKQKVVEDQDYLLAFIATIPHSSPVSKELLDLALKSEYRTHIISHIRSHDLIDEFVLNRAIAKFVMKHGEISDAEIDAMLPGLENAHQVARIQEAELIWPI